jgi:hypothetical protein
MNHGRIRLLLSLLLWPSLVLAADRAARLSADLTPLGAERAGNADGNIPPWSGVAPAAPASWAPGARYADPFPDEKPLLVITAENAEKQAKLLTPGQRALLAAYPEYRLPVYPSHRQAIAPEAWYAGTAKNAVLAHIATDSGLPERVVAGAPFPIIRDEPEGGLEAIWNHRLRWRGEGRDRSYLEASIAPTGAVDLVQVRERQRFLPFDAPPLKNSGQVLVASMFAVLTPPRIAGALKLVHETVSGDGAAWQRSPGPDLPMFRKTTDAGKDIPLIGTDGLMTEDQREGFAGSPERYNWRLDGKREVLVPYDAYRLHAEGIPAPELLSTRQLNPALLRYERHRVWVVEAKLKPNAIGVWQRRTFYLDEDSWQVLIAELYGADDRLQRVQEVHTLMAWDQALLLPVLETVHDLAGQRYLALGVDNERPGEIGFATDDIAEFETSKARRWAREIGAVPRK